ncbi:predicted protein [Pyrenophora tritici-repentis Pt-1C-BFP]|uniref:Uncharacterized protein n=1 Tax=Pyrenophora tritici-repentis (strain Pt-1C-BFP) TaxID=426418 RepID=B2W6N0_PYRTR|nr:uncharacterized protein PTRG_05468 [Pyrenophora tritici-repentis Pt-1C-BFP]EDU48388.1 predicted protein [Pyrenophora tritici-repentis Pt-1C-BFP]
MNLTFLPRPTQSRPGKRSRAIADIDGEHSCTQKKKRRLRLVLITSRLSPQFSHPATNIVDRGSSKIAVWAKQKALGRNLLRKAAILNGIRRRNMSSKGGNGGRRGRILVGNEKEQAQFELARLEFDHGSIDTYTRPVLSQDPSVPPSGLIHRLKIAIGVREKMKMSGVVVPCLLLHRVPEFLSYNPIVNVHIAEFPPSRYDREDDDAVYTALADVAGIGESKVGVAEFWG